MESKGSSVIDSHTDESGWGLRRPVGITSRAHNTDGIRSMSLMMPKQVLNVKENKNMGLITWLFSSSVYVWTLQTELSPGMLFPFPYPCGLHPWVW